jgi:hypothetical protein
MEDGRYRSIENLLLSISLSKRSTIYQVGFELEGWLENRFNKRSECNASDPIIQEEYFEIIQPSFYLLYLLEA